MCSKQKQNKHKHQTSKSKSKTAYANPMHRTTLSDAHKPWAHILYIKSQLANIFYKANIYETEKCSQKWVPENAETNAWWMKMWNSEEKDQRY